LYENGTECVRFDWRGRVGDLVTDRLDTKNRCSRRPNEQDCDDDARSEQGAVGDTEEADEARRP
jgi:hypothetical protein